MTTILTAAIVLLSMPYLIAGLLMFSMWFLDVTLPEAPKPKKKDNHE